MILAVVIAPLSLCPLERPRQHHCMQESGRTMISGDHTSSTVDTLHTRQEDPLLEMPEVLRSISSTLTDICAVLW